MTRQCPFVIPLLIGLILTAVSGTIYALTVDIWMLLLGRGVLGFGGGIGVPALHTYLGEMGSVMDQLREEQGKTPRKFSVYIAYSFILNGGFLVAFGECVCVYALYGVQSLF